MTQSVVLNPGVGAGLGRPVAQTFGRRGIDLSALTVNDGDTAGGSRPRTPQEEHSERSKAVVDAYYQAGVRGRLSEFAPYLHSEFTTTAPNFLPWGGMHKGAAFFRDHVLTKLPEVLDFGRFAYDVLFADGERVVALVHFGLWGSDATIKLSEHWTTRDGKAASIWIAYFEPQALLDKLGISHGLTARARS